MDARSHGARYSLRFSIDTARKMLYCVPTVQLEKFLTKIHAHLFEQEALDDDAGWRFCVYCDIILDLGLILLVSVPPPAVN